MGRGDGCISVRRERMLAGAVKFAWWPVRLIGGERVWLRPVWRRYEVNRDYGDFGGEAELAPVYEAIEYRARRSVRTRSLAQTSLGASG